jgi:MATE family multidrug resistance protein
MSSLVNNTPQKTTKNITPKYHRQIWSFAWPMMLANITVPLLGLVDTAVLGHLEHSGYLAGVAIGGNIFTFIFWAFGFLRMGTTGLIAQAYGKQDTSQLLRTLIQSIGLALLIGIVIIANQVWLIPTAITLMDGSQQTQALATAYCNIRIWGAPATLIQYALIGTYIGLQKPKASLVILIIINLLNIIFDVWFVVLLKWNVTGVALATVLAEYIGAFISLGYLYYFLYQYFQSTTASQSDQRRALLTWPLKALLNRDDLSRFFNVNSDIFIRTCCLLFVFAFFTSQGAKQGDVILAANAVLLTFLLLISNTLDGFANAAEAIVGKFMGQMENKKHTSKQQLMLFIRAALQWCVGFTALLMLIFYLFGPSIITLLTDINDVQETAKKYLTWLILMPALSCLSYLYDGIFVGATQTRSMRNIMIVCLLLIFIPLWMLTQTYGNHGLWFAFSAFMLSRSILMWLSCQRFLQSL